MKISKASLASAVAITVLSAPAWAQNPGFFAGVDVTTGTTHGSSSTKAQGAAFAGGGVVRNIKFGTTTGIGGHAGYQMDPALSAFISYQYIRGDISWDANFPQIGAASRFSGSAISHVVLANVAYDWALSDATTIKAMAGVGASFNRLSGVTERDGPSSAFLSDVANHTQSGPAAQLGAAIQHYLTPNAVIGLSASVAYTGSFRTGSTRSGNLGVTPISPYEINDVWRASLGASAQIRF